jgi:uncharacterized membrane protein
MITKTQKCIVLFWMLISVTSPVFAQDAIDSIENTPEESELSVSTVRARVESIVDVRESGVVFGTGQPIILQEIEARVLNGQFEGQIISLDQDYLGMKVGDTFLAEEFVVDGVPEYRLLDFDRRAGLSWILLAFIVMVLVFAKWQGLRSLISLAGSILIIVYVLVPLLLSGAPPILTSVSLAVLILAVAIFFTHGFNRRSLIAFSGTVVTVMITGLLAAWVVNGTHLTGFSDHSATYLDLNTGGQLDFVGLLLAGIIVGVLGVLDDIAITQVAVVRELYGANKSLTRWDVFRRAIRVGKEHVAALVNTLVLAYVGVAMPLMLYVSTLGVTDVQLLLNSEVFATEIVRTIIGSIGLILSVPLTTLAAAIFLEKYKGLPPSPEEIAGSCVHVH